MRDRHHPTDPGAGRWWMRLRRAVALVVGGVASLFWVVVLVGSLLGHDDEHVVESAAVEGALLSVLVVANVVSFGVTVLRPRVGSRMLAAAAGALAVFAWWSAGRNHLVAVAVSAGPFALSSWLSWTPPTSATGTRPDDAG